ncbi:hypothetical protein RRG08_029740 [Elysia crispata]|uniref:Uncharacterized protein n=1 Tax=Elysia crispata TaxID=231223 RepID=A0AAE1AGI7_9GAST|nr:hypothetical protein RRG08_029740 [Elysia crispata]
MDGLEINNPVFDANDYVATGGDYDIPLDVYTPDETVGGDAETSFSTRDGSTFDATADVYSTDGTSVGTLPDPPRITRSFRPGDLRDEIIAADFAAAKTALGKVIPLRNNRGGGFLALSTLASKYGNGGTDALRTSMGLKDYNSKTRKTGKLSPKEEKNVQHAYDILPDEDVDITPVVADHTIASVEIATKALDEELTPEESAALGTINDPPLDLHGVRLCGGWVRLCGGWVLAGGRL